ncbi:membrane dipeptidase [Lentzea xinjiangensis]|uniref:Membrane dipeptidase n=1 Tax=Lentzea xinjiangensis TaxID=402600 RepID=A0A1H9VWD3_9PSEU|nr:dipeptidase [Lentzea xinjiangensis]SES26066.1 membrane dipeptidase [Lentzea xinjiangensis]
MTGDLHARSVVADTHNDLLDAIAHRPAEQWVPHFRERWLPQLQAGGVNLQVLPVFVDDVFRPEGALRRTLRMIEAAHRIAEGNPDTVALCRTGAEIDAALAGDRIALVLALESAPGVGEDVELFETLFRLGVRIASLAHFGRTALADGSGEDATGGRLTRAGVAAVAEMERLGMIFDVSHLSAAGVEHVLELATRPVMATHSSARALRDHHRNLTDEQLKGIAANGGVVCVNFFAPFLHETDFGIDRLIDHIEHIAGVMGVRHVGLGPDFVEEVLRDVTPPCCEVQFIEGVPVDRFLPGLEGPAGLPLVTEALRRRGWPDDDIALVLGQNVLDLFRSELTRGPAS